MEKTQLESWKKAQEGEFAFWKFRESQGITLPPESVERYNKCLNLLPLRINHTTRILDVGSGPNGGICFFAPESSLKVSLDPLIGKEVFSKEVVRGTHAIQAIGECLPFVESIFEVIFCINSLDHSFMPSRMLAELSKVIKRTGYLVAMVHVVTPREKIIHFILHKTRFCKILFANSFIRFCVGNFFRLPFKLLFGFNVIDDGILHPFYFALNDVVALFNQAGFAIIKIRLHPSPWNYKKELFVVACRHLN